MLTIKPARERYQALAFSGAAFLTGFSAILALLYHTGTTLDRTIGLTKAPMVSQQPAPITVNDQPDGSTTMTTSDQPAAMSIRPVLLPDTSGDTPVDTSVEVPTQPVVTDPTTMEPSTPTVPSEPVVEVPVVPAGPVLPVTPPVTALPVVDVPADPSASLDVSTGTGLGVSVTVGQADGTTTSQ